MKSRAWRLLIGGEWVPSDGPLVVRDAFTGNEVGSVPLANRDTVLRAIDAAETALEETRRIAPHARAALLERIADGISKHSEEFVEAIVAEAGKPIVFAEAEVARATMTFRTAANETRQAHGELLALDALPSGEGHFGLARRFPIGVISAITPFNFPLNLVAHKVAPCLATHNTMVVKPSSTTPITALLLAQVLVEAGLPPGQVNVVTCRSEDSAPLIEDERVKMISFTGSPEVGWKLKERSGRKRVTLELGGNAGVILHGDADVEAAVPLIASGGFGHAGQSCISVQRVLVHEEIYEDFKGRLVEHIREKIKAGDPRDRKTVVGPMISGDAFQQAVARIESAVRAGAKLVCGGPPPSPSPHPSRVLPPTVLEDVPVSEEVVRCELFAPIITLHRYRDFDEAVTFLNDSRFGLQAGVFTRDLRLALCAFDALEVGGVMINQVPTWRVESMPYGGVKESGFGREGVRYAMEEMTELKSLVVRLT